MFSLCVLPPFLICFCFFYTFRNWRGSQEWKNCQSDWGGGWPFDWHQPQRFTYVLSAWCALFDTDAHLQYAMVCMYACVNVHICTCVCEWLCDRVYLDVSIRKCWVFCGNFKNVCAYIYAGITKYEEVYVYVCVPSVGCTQTYVHIWIYRVVLQCEKHFLYVWLPKPTYKYVEFFSIFILCTYVCVCVCVCSLKRVGKMWQTLNIKDSVSV